MAKKGKGKIKIQTESALRKKYAGSGNGADILISPEDMLWIPSRFLALNDQWGGGACYGKIHEIYGEESSGKSLLAYDFAYCTQQLGGIVMWGDAEFAFMKGWAEQNGLDVGKVELYPEKAIELISDWSMDMGIYYRSKLVKNEPILLVVDSIAALECMENLNSSQADAKAEMGNRAKQMDKWLRTRQSSYEELGITVLLINQLRSNIGGGMFADPDCLHYNTTIPLTDGTFKTIGEIVDNRLEVKVWSLDEKGEIIEKEISDWIAKDDWGKDDKWYNLLTTGPSTRNGVNGITCTGGHLVMNNQGNWVRADQLKVGDLLISKAMLPNKETMALLETMSIGDMGINIRKENSASITLRDNNNPEYINWKLSLLEPILSFEKDIDKRGYTYYRSDYHYFLTEVKRNINRDPLNCENLFDGLSMAIWYMDDGHLSKGRASISISPNRTNLEKLALVITKRGFQCKPYKKGIRFTKEGSIKLFKHIGKYIHTSMYYKIPEEYIKESNIVKQPLALELKPIEVMVTKIEEAGERNYRGRKGKIKYDLSIEGTKNFLAGNTTNGFIVHNTTPGGKATRYYASIRAGVYGGKQITKKIKGKEKRIGKLSSIRIKKNKVAPPKPTIKGAEVYFTDDADSGIGFNKYFGLPELLIEKEVITRKKGSSRYYMGDKMIANGEDAFLRKLYEDADLRKKLIRKSGINTISKTQKQLDKLTGNLYPVTSTDFDKHDEIEDEA